MMLLLAQSGVALDSTSSAWTLIGLGVMGIIYLGVVRPMMRKKRDPLERGPAFSSIAQQRSTERQMQNLLVELAEMSRQITAQLDTRSAKLEALIQEADEKIAALQSAGPAMVGRRDSFVAAAAEPASAPASPPMEIDPRHSEVYRLADAGQDARAIADELGRPSGEVELILALRSRG